MKRCGKTFISLAGTLVLAVGVRADVTETAATSDPANDQPYSAIWVRNVFDLKPPAPPPSAPVTNLPPANVKLLGISTILGNKRAIVSLQESAAPGHPPQKEETFIMTEGQRHGPLEVVEIDPANRTVKVKNDGLVSTLAFETNKAATAVAPATVAPPAFGVPRPPAFGARPGSPSPFLPPRMVAPQNGAQPNNPTGYPAGFPPTGLQQNTQAQENYAAIMALRQQQAEQAQDAQNAAQSVPASPKVPRGFGARVTGTYNVPPQQP